MPRVSELLRRSCLKDVHEPAPSLAELRRTERSPEFEELRLNRKVMGALRYGRLGAPGKPQFDRVGSMIERLKAYRKDRNAEHLVDVANLAEVEFVEGGAVLRAVDDGEHTKEC